MDDLKSGSNKWSYCNYNDPDVGFPRDCGPNGYIANTWFSFPGGKFNARGLTSGSGFELWDGSDCPVTATQSPSPSPPPPPLEEQCPISTSTADAGYVDAYRGWYDASGCGICQDYCRWVGNSGPGGDPSKKTTHGSSWWSCRAAKGTAAYTGKTEYGSTFGFAKCSGQGATPPQPSLEEQCPISTSTADAGYVDAYRGWYDASGCGICQDYCRWVGNSGPGGDPSKKTTHGSSWWSCRAAKGTAAYTGKTEYGSTFGFAKCSGQGATPP